MVATTLTTVKTWRRERPATAPRLRQHDLSPEEQANVRKALVFLKTRLGGWPKLAKAIGSPQISSAGAYRRSALAGVAVRAAKLAGVPVDDVLSGR